MTTTINASTSSGLVNTADTSGILQLQTANTAAVTIDASQNVGIGNTSPSYPLDVKQTSTGNIAGFRATSASYASDGVVVLIDRNTSNNTFNAMAYYNTGASAYRFKVADSGAIATAGSISLGTATPATSGIGVQFPATQSASSDANTLDDYEEGTWTPTDASGAGLTLNILTTSTYTKCGNMVIAFASVSYPSTASGLQATIGGLPFTTASSGYSGATPRYTDRSFMHFGAMNTGTSIANIYGLSGSAPTNAQFSGGRTDLMFIFRTA